LKLYTTNEICDKMSSIRIVIPIFNRLELLFNLINNLEISSIKDYPIKFLIVISDSDDIDPVRKFMEQKEIDYELIIGHKNWYWGKSIYNAIKYIKLNSLFDSIFVFMNQDIDTNSRSVINLVSNIKPDSKYFLTSYSLDNSNLPAADVVHNREYIIRLSQLSVIKITDQNIMLTGFRLIAVPGIYFKLPWFFTLRFTPHYYADYVLCLIAMLNRYRIELTNADYIHTENPGTTEKRNFLFRFLSVKGTSFLPAIITFYILKFMYFLKSSIKLYL
jgi:GT2 family glycosyltransferase